MNTNTNELRALNFNESLPEDFIEVPLNLQQEANKELDGKISVHIPFNSKSPLSKWAQKIRENQKKSQITKSQNH